MRRTPNRWDAGSRAFRAAGRQCSPAEDKCPMSNIEYRMAKHFDIGHSVLDIRHLFSYDQHPTGHPAAALTMAYDEQFADRIRKALGRRKGLVAKQMFGGIAFLLNGNMCVGIHKDELIVRLDP